MDLHVEHNCICLFSIHRSSSVRCVQVLCVFSNGTLFSLLLSGIFFLISFGSKCFVTHVSCKHMQIFLSMVFILCLSQCVFKAKGFSFEEVQLISAFVMDQKLGPKMLHSGRKAQAIHSCTGSGACCER